MSIQLLPYALIADPSLLQKQSTIDKLSTFSMTYSTVLRSLTWYIDSRIVYCICVPSKQGLSSPGWSGWGYYSREYCNQSHLLIIL